ncbi:succinate dehydrogenase cytochrome b558 subunit [Mammaliicoccus sciuri]|uniref:Succinate dehydrogenase subunit C n=2 Tax=Sporosarcina newyorkensis TaxID=759851 RepID=A0A1T4XNX1_9BACL|nr:MULTISPECIES: succinate dehydrogenase cytochrome b558 subunit [Sporosarcina]EGQ22400.1 succinate dehydrogenase cytochrome b558 subunit [Sporosarcina newyorkensis 2681]MBY0222448.1 succinate dehydrogenase cytochrome b558 subunit [Sporosarcina aquimarina]SKA91254.1 succinate dehydrogenase subunit C [Sporosarcina newyorkensis]
MSKESDFFLRRLHSLLGVIPVGLFVAQHLVINHFATRGEEAFNTASNFMGNLPFVTFLEWFIIYIPLMFHAFYGVYIAFSAKYNVNHYGTFRNWMFTLQRFTGVFLVIFIAWHVYETRIQKALGATVDYNMMADILSNPLMLVFYIVGILSATFHLANGLWSFCVTWGIAQSPNSQKIVSYITMIVFLVLSVIGIQALLAFV